MELMGGWVSYDFKSHDLSDKQTFEFVYASVNITATVAKLLCVFAVRNDVHLPFLNSNLRSFKRASLVS